MDVKQYFRKIREVEASLIEEFPVLKSLETSDGGKPGTLAEVSRENAARMIVEGRAVAATLEEIEEYRASQSLARKAAAKAEMAKRIQFAIVTEDDSQPASAGKRGGLVPSGK
jgi:hypothetical protein